MRGTRRLWRCLGYVAGCSLLPSGVGPVGLEFSERFEHTAFRSFPSQAPQWLESDSCQKCEQPFFWNIKQMWDSKTMGLRQVRTAGICSLTAMVRNTVVPFEVNTEPETCVCVCVMCSTTAGNAARRCAGSVAASAPPTPSWALSSRCGCVTPASTPSRRKSE